VIFGMLLPSKRAWFVLICTIQGTPSECTQTNSKKVRKHAWLVVLIWSLSSHVGMRMTKHRDPLYLCPLIRRTGPICQSWFNELHKSRRHDEKRGLVLQNQEAAVRASSHLAVTLKRYAQFIGIIIGTIV
jgi:hypothetical protein